MEKKVIKNTATKSEKVLRGLLIAVSLLLVCALVVQCLFWAGLFGKESPSTASAQIPAGVGSLSREGYTLEQVVVLSRHNIRSPLSGSGSALGTITPHEWFQWSSNPSELSLRGGVLETEMGQYFRKWLESEGLFPENYHPTEDEVRIYANAKQRTIATAEYFVSGLLPTANTPIETHVEYDTMDPVFTPQLTFVSPEYNADAEAQVWELYGDTVSGLADNYALIADVIDMEQSEAWKDGSATAFVTDDSQLVLEVNKEPGVKGSLKTACSVSDALVLQYFEESDDAKAAFGHTLTEEQWKQISEVKDVYGDVLFTAPLIAANVAHPLLQEIEAELTTDGRAFSFLCGHDSNVGSVLAALGAESYELPGAIEKTPIGCKLVFSRWVGPDGESYCTVDMVYETVDQLRSAPLLDLEQHPAVVPMRFAGVTPNADGLYTEADFMNLLHSSIAEYDRIMETYKISSPAVDGTKALSLWNDGTGAREQLIDYVSSVTEEGGADYIPVEDRIAVFDMDGTLACETFYTYYDTMMFIEYCLYEHPERVSDELKAVAASIQPGYVADETLARNFAKAYAGMTVEEFYQYAVEFGQKETASFNNMRYIDNFYLPMVELVQYLYENGFEIWVISGTERTTTRAIVANSPIKDYVLPEHIIGTDFEVKLRGHEDEASNMNFKYEDGDELVLTGGFIQKNLNANKAIYVEREIGKHPVLAFGNSGSDTSMMNYALDGRNPYNAQAYMIVADDNVREWGTQDWATKSADYIAKGFIPISMKDDFAVIYPEGITKAEQQYTPADVGEELDQAA